jgi:hypothetical protein
VIIQRSLIQLLERGYEAEADGVMGAITSF